MTDDAHEKEEPFPEDVVLPVEDTLDLHSFLPGDVRSVVRSFLEAAVEAGFRQVRIIHGKGIGVQREIVRSVLKRHPAVVSVRNGGTGGGEWGATVADLDLPDECSES